MSWVVPDCAVWPFLVKENKISAPSALDSAVKGFHSPTIAELSQALAFSQGKPLAFKSACTSRAVKSIPTVIASTQLRALAALMFLAVLPIRDRYSLNCFGGQ
jgi:hypothetical protein